MSAESGIKTFRDADGLWEGHDVMEVATPEGFATNPELVLDFYNQRRKQLFEVEPNSAHFDISILEKDFKVSIITQNVDDLHERAGSTDVIHLQPCCNGLLGFHGLTNKILPPKIQYFVASET